MNTNSLIKTTCLICLVVSMSVTRTTDAAKLYKWVDSKGRISYQDQPPPKNAKVLSEKYLKAKISSKTEPLIEANTTPIDVYITVNCASCDDLLGQLDDLNVPYNAKDIKNHRDIQDRIIQETDSLTVPTAFIQNKLTKFPTTDALKKALKDAGYQTTKKPKEPVESDETISSE